MTREEAIKIIRDNIHHLGIGATQMTEALGSLVPELCENEDERVIKALEAFINQPEIADKITFEARIECLTWLEKQKEQKHPNGCFTCDEYKKGYEEGRRNGFTAGYNKAMKEVEQKEQKPAEWSDYKDKVNIPYCSSEPEWSEEDEEMLEYIIGDVNDAKQLYTTQEAKDMADKEISWLKSLRPSWKPSDQDELMKSNMLEQAPN